MGRVRNKIVRSGLQVFGGTPTESRPEDLPAGRILIGTHHKAGTVWMRSVFQQVSTELGLPYLAVNWGDHINGDWAILHHVHSGFPAEVLEVVNCRGVHMIRDPRDRIVSGTFYHGKSKESWLHVPQDDLGGLTYQEAINKLGSVEDKILFEMEYIAGRTIRQMAEWNYDDPRFYEVKYEDLVQDRNLRLFRDIFEFLGFGGEALLRCLGIAFENSLFSGKVVRSQHVRSGESRQWAKHFTRRHAERFLELYGDVLLLLGYEENDDWVISCPG